MSDKPIRDDTAHIYCSTDTRDEICALKRGGETYDELLRRMSKQYDPEAGRGEEGAADGC